MADMRFEFENERPSVARAGLVLNPRVRFPGRGARRLRSFVLLLVTALLLTTPGATGAASVPGGNRCAFIGYTNFSSLSKSQGTLANETVFTSRELTAPIDWDELVISWNVPPGVHLKVEARAIYPSHSTRYYTMGLWSDDTTHFPRESVRR